MQTLFDLTQNGYDILTCGTNSIILKKGNYVYKITREFSSVDVMGVKRTLDRLKEEGVNVLPILNIEEVRFHSATDFNLSIGGIMDAKHKNQKWDAQYNETLQNMKDQDCYVLPMLKFDYIEGENLFGEKRLDALKLISKTPTLKNAKVLHPVIVEKLNSSLLPSLEIAEKLSSREVYKFMEDCDKILQTGLSIDNRTGDNFIYGEDAYGNKGIFIIDLGGIENMSRGNSKGETNLFCSTIDNLCKMIYVETKADLGETTNRIAKVFDKYNKVTKKFVKDCVAGKPEYEENFVNKHGETYGAKAEVENKNVDVEDAFAKYMQTDNYFKKLQKNCENVNQKQRE